MAVLTSPLVEHPALLLTITQLTLKDNLTREDLDTALSDEAVAEEQRTRDVSVQCDGRRFNCEQVVMHELAEANHRFKQMRKRQVGCLPSYEQP